MTQFNEIKEEIIKRAHEANACAEQYKRAYSSASIEELFVVIKDNFYWCSRNKVIDQEFIYEYRDVFAKNNIFCNVNSAEGYILVDGNATVRACDNATVEACDNTYVISYYEIECKLNNNAIHRIISTNELHYCSEEIKLVKV